MGNPHWMVIWGHVRIEGTAAVEAIRVRDELRIPYPKLFPMHALTIAMNRLVEELGEEHVVHTSNLIPVGVVLSPTDKATSHRTSVTLVHEGLHRTLSPKPDGSFEVPYDPRLVHDGAYLLVESPGQWNFKPIAPSDTESATDQP